MQSVDEFTYNPYAIRFGVHPIDPGWIYLVEHQSRFKIGRTSNPKKRFREARTWIPDINVIALKPFWGCRYVERVLHITLVWHWHANEWHQFLDEEHERFIVSELVAFDDYDINKNSVDFPYFINGSGLGEFGVEFASRKTTLSKWRQQEA